MKHKNLVLGLVVISLAGGVWWVIDQPNLNFLKETKVNQVGQVKPITPKQFNELAKAQDTFVLDVHVPEQKHIPGTDAFIPYNQLAQNLNKLPKDKNTPILVYCRSGSMSAQAAQELLRLGYTNVFDLQGGIKAYNQVFNSN